MTEILTGELGWYVPAGAQWCPRCGDQNWDERRLCLTCTNGEPPLWEDGQYHSMHDKQPAQVATELAAALDIPLTDWQTELIRQMYATRPRFPYGQCPV